jgi:hypothetical protein
VEISEVVVVVVAVVIYHQRPWCEVSGKADGDKADVDQTWIKGKQESTRPTTLWNNI